MISSQALGRRLLLRHYWWLGIVLGIVAGVAVYRYAPDNRIALIGAIIAGTLGFYYFVQQQKLAETTLFHELFGAFNGRYSAMNEQLAEIAARGDAPTDEERHAIVDYFNLCAEEYLFYQQGYIHCDAWQSWCRGMRWYLEHKRFRKVWQEEVKTESFYGLSLAEIKKGA